MTPWIYDYTAPPVAKWGMANGEPSVELDIPETRTGIAPARTNGQARQRSSRAQAARNSRSAGSRLR